MDEKIAILAGIVLVSFTVQALTGFGSIIIAVTLGSHFLPIDVLLPILVPLDLLLNGYITARYWKKVDMPLLMKKVFPFMGAGLAAGIIFINKLSEITLKLVFGVFIVLLSSWELINSYRKRAPRNITQGETALFLLIGGLAQGVFASGGPPVVYALGRTIRDRGIFRSTLSCLWLIANAILTVDYFVTGRLTLTTTRQSLLLLLPVLAGIIIGDRFHHRVNEKHFRIIVYCLLLVAGVSILLSIPW